MGTLLIIGALAGGGLLLASKTGALASLTGGPKLYALTDADATAIQQNYGNGRVSGGNGNFRVGGQTFAQWMHQAILTLRVTVYTNDKFCQGAPPSGASVLQLGITGAGSAVAEATNIGNAASPLAGGLTGFLGSASNALPIIGTVIGIFQGVMSFIGAHHAAAVRKENAILCPLLPAVNQAFANLEAKMRSGALNGSQVNQEADQIVTETMQVISQDPGSGALHAVGEEVEAVRDAFALIVSRSGI